MADSQWDTRVWLVLPNGSAIVRAELCPCRQCGSTVWPMLVRIESDGGKSLTVGCGQCCRRRHNDVQIGTLDTETQEITLYAAGRRPREERVCAS